MEFLAVLDEENWNAEATGIDESVSGVIVADNGPEILILSYASICEDAKEWCVTFSDKSEYKASLKNRKADNYLQSWLLLCIMSAKYLFPDVQ